MRGLHPDPVLNIYGSPIPVVEEAKFLGLLFDKKPTFIPHVKALKAKCLKASDVLKVLSNTNWGGDRSVFLNLYMAPCHPQGVEIGGCFVLKAGG